MRKRPGLRFLSFLLCDLSAQLISTSVRQSDSMSTEEAVECAKRASDLVQTDEAQAKRQATALSMLSSAALDEDASEELAANEGARNIFEEQLRQLQVLQQEHVHAGVGGKVHVSDSDDDDEEKEGKSNKIKNKWLLPPKQQRGPRVGDEYQANLP